MHVKKVLIDSMWCPKQKIQKKNAWFLLSERHFSALIKMFDPKDHLSCLSCFLCEAYLKWSNRACAHVHFSFISVKHTIVLDQLFFLFFKKPFPSQHNSLSFNYRFHVNLTLALSLMNFSLILILLGTAQSSTITLTR